MTFYRLLIKILFCLSELTNITNDYICRSFDNLNRGGRYLDIQPAIHIGFLDYTLFSDQPKFYATYKLMNMKNHHVYSDNFVLNVVNLTRTNLATDEDRKYHIDEWAKLFKATTWEEVRKMAAQNEYLQEASKSIFVFNTDEQIRKMCRDRIEYHQDIHNYQRFVAQQEQIILEKENALAEKENVIAEKENVIIEKENVIAEKDNALAKRDDLIASLYAQIEKLTTENEKSRA